jgi:hypothetical protein
MNKLECLWEAETAANEGMIRALQGDSSEIAPPIKAASSEIGILLVLRRSDQVYGSTSKSSTSNIKVELAGIEPTDRAP